MKTIQAACWVMAATIAAGCSAAAPDGGPEAAGDPTASIARAPVEKPSAAARGLKAGDTTSKSDELVIYRRCDEASCSAAGGACAGLFCEPGCEQSPGSCTATVSNAYNGYGFIGITCTGIGNGIYTVSETAAPGIQFSLGTMPPSMGWVGYNPYGTGTYDYVFQNQQVQFVVDEDDIYLPGCNNGTNLADCQIKATYVQVCAQPGAGQFTEQSGLCGNLESFPAQCVTVPVTYQ